MEESKRTPLIGVGVPDQHRLRPTARVRNLDEFLAFLNQVRVLAPDLPAADRPVTTGDRFLL